MNLLRVRFFHCDRPRHFAPLAMAIRSLYLIGTRLIISFSNPELPPFFELMKPCELRTLYLFCVPACMILPSAWPQRLYMVFSDVSVCLLVWLYSVSTGFWLKLIWLRGPAISNRVEL